MPFIKQERRPYAFKADWKGLVEKFGTIEYGDKCAYYYKQMVDTWKANPCWTTAHEIFQGILTDDLELDDCTASRLAWQVFFIKYVMRYEDQKEEENGTI